MNRIEKFAARLPENVDCVLVTSAYSRQYFTQMRSSAGTLIVTREKAYFIIDFRYIEKAREKVTDAEVILRDKIFVQIDELMKKHSVKNVAIETDYLTVSEFTQFKKDLPDYNFSEDSAVNDIILNLRSHKEASEVECIRKAQQIADKAFSHMLTFIQAGQTEREVATELEHKMAMLGSEGISFDTIAVSGKNSSLPHGVPTDKKLEDGDFLTMDFGATINGYHSDMTRTVAIGSVTDEMRKVYETVLAANLASLEHVKIGNSNVSVDKVGRDLIDAAGYQGCFGHGTGHSVGLEIHEEPRYSKLAKGDVEAGHIMTVEPGIYLEGKFGVRIEDIIYISEDGVEILSTSPKDLIVLN